MSTSELAVLFPCNDEAWTDSDFLQRHLNKNKFPPYSSRDVLTACRNFIFYYSSGNWLGSGLEDLRCLISQLNGFRGEHLISPACFHTYTPAQAADVIFGHSHIPPSFGTKNSQSFSFGSSKSPVMNPSFFKSQVATPEVKKAEVKSVEVGRTLVQVGNWDTSPVEGEYSAGLPQPSDFEIVVNWHKVMVARLKSLQESEIKDIGFESSYDYSPSCLQDLDSLSGSHLVSYLAYLVINCLKFIVGDEGGKTSAEFPIRVTENFNKFWGHDVKLPTPPPHPRLASLFARSFSTQSPPGLSLLAPLVWTMKQPPKDPSVNLYKLLREGILEPLSHYSLGAFYWYLKANKYISNLLPKDPTMAPISISINRMVQFNNTFVTDTKLKEVTWKWARIFNSEMFPDISIENNTLFTLTCIALTEGRQSDHQVWEMQSIRPYLGMKDVAIKLAADIQAVKSVAINNSSQPNELTKINHL